MSLRSRGARRAALVLVGLMGPRSAWAEEVPSPAPVLPTTILLEAPLSAPRLSFFHAALDVPPLDTARVLPAQALYVQLETSHARSVESRRIDGVPSTFDGLYHEWAALEAAFGLFPFLEVGIRTVLAGWDEQLDRFTLLDGAGAPIVRDEAGVVLQESASQRHDNLSDVTLRAKALLAAREDAGLDLALLAAVKIPVARARDLTHAGTTDLSFTLLASLSVGPVTLHANGGVGVPLGGQEIFVADAGVDLEPFFHGGVAVVYPLPLDFAAILQVEANSSAFRDVEFLDEPPLTIFAGGRKLLGRLILEAGGGVGLLPLSSYDWEAYLAIGYVWGPTGIDARG